MFLGEKKGLWSVFLVSCLASCGNLKINSVRIVFDIETLTDSQHMIVCWERRGAKGYGLFRMKYFWGFLHVPFHQRVFEDVASFFVCARWEVRNIWEFFEFFFMISSTNMFKCFFRRRLEFLKSREFWLSICLWVFCCAYLFACTSDCMTFCLSACTTFCLSVCMHEFMFVCMHEFMFVCMYDFLSVCLSACTTFCLCVCMHNILSVCTIFGLSACRTFCLSVFLFLFFVFSFVCLTVFVYFLA